LHGFVGGNNGTMLSTSNGGSTWTAYSQDLFSSLNIRDLIYDGSGHVIIAGGLGGIGSIYISNDNGNAKWSLTGGTGAFYGIASMHDPGNSSYTVVGTGGLSLTTSDLGRNWTLAHADGADFLAADFFDAVNGI